MIIYLAGPIDGHINYRQRFFETEKKLQKMGHIVINPAYLPSGIKDYMPICKAMIDQADGIFFLRGWIDSNGSNEEYLYAHFKKMPMFFEEYIKEECEAVKYWRYEAIKNCAMLGEIRIKIANKEDDLMAAVNPGGE